MNIILKPIDPSPHSKSKKVINNERNKNYFICKIYLKHTVYIYIMYTTITCITLTERRGQLLLCYIKNRSRFKPAGGHPFEGY